MAAELGTVVTIDYNDLFDNSKDLATQIEEAYGTEATCLGILLVKNVPGFVERRQALLPLALEFAKLSDDIKKKYEDEPSHYSVGWSHGKEILQDGKPDIYKGSYYANPQYNRPTEDEKLMKSYPEYCLPNVWPSEVAKLEEAFMNLGHLIVTVGTQVAKHCDQYVEKRCPSYEKGKLARIISSSRAAKARLLHYFPPSKDVPDENPWCGLHLDHGSLTGLTSAMYMSQDGKEVNCPDPNAGLYILTRGGKTFKAVIPKDALAFQLGETAQVHTAGLLRATPHFVRAPAHSSASEGISRETFACFMQPMWDEPLNIPEERTPEQVDTAAWKPGQTFIDFTKALLNKYYLHDAATEDSVPAV